MTAEVRPAAAFDGAELTALFNAGFAGYLVPMRMDEEAFAQHVGDNDIDLDCSRVVLDAGPVAFTLVARRGEAAWIGGMGTVPAARRRGLGRRALEAAMGAAAQTGARTVSLEVLEANAPARTLYEALGFVRTRMLTVWSLEPTRRERPAAESPGLDAGLEWIAAHRAAPEPWQRAGESIRRMRERGAALAALAFPSAVAVHRDDGTVLQIAAGDETAATRALLAAASPERGLRLGNLPDEGPVPAALRGLGARPVARQLELRRSL